MHGKPEDYTEKTKHLRRPRLNTVSTYPLFSPPPLGSRPLFMTGQRWPWTRKSSGTTARGNGVLTPTHTDGQQESWTANRTGSSGRDSGTWRCNLRDLIAAAQRTTHVIALRGIESEACLLTVVVAGRVISKTANFVTAGNSIDRWTTSFTLKTTISIIVAVEAMSFNSIMAVLSLSVQTNSRRKQLHSCFFMEARLCWRCIKSNVLCATAMNNNKGTKALSF